MCLALHPSLGLATVLWEIPTSQRRTEAVEFELLVQFTQLITGGLAFQARSLRASAGVAREGSSAWGLAVDTKEMRLVMPNTETHITTHAPTRHSEEMFGPLTSTQGPSPRALKCEWLPSVPVSVCGEWTGPHEELVGG